MILYVCKSFQKNQYFLRKRKPLWLGNNSFSGNLTYVPNGWSLTSFHILIASTRQVKWPETTILCWYNKYTLKRNNIDNGKASVDAVLEFYSYTNIVAWT